MKILLINSCIRSESRTYNLAKYLLDKLDGEKEIINLYETNLKPLNEELLNKRYKLIALNDYNDEYFNLAKSLKNADVIIIASPYYDLSFSSYLKLFIENTAILNLTFAYSDSGRPYSLINCKKLYYVTTSGGPILNDEYGFGYIKGVFKTFYNVDDFEYIKAEKLDVDETKVDELINNAKLKIDNLIK